jgi:hypothetical protein
MQLLLRCSALLSHQRAAKFCTNTPEIRTVGGTGVPYIQQWCSAPTTYSNTSIFTVDTVNGTVLTWDVYVRDANLCVGIVPVTIVSDVQLLCSASATVLHRYAIEY